MYNFIYRYICMYLGGTILRLVEGAGSKDDRIATRTSSGTYRKACGRRESSLFTTYQLVRMHFIIMMN